jgi:hypothetical protein
LTSRIPNPESRIPHRRNPQHAAATAVRTPACRWPRRRVRRNRPRVSQGSNDARRHRRSPAD